MDYLPAEIQEIIRDRGCHAGVICPINTVFVLRGIPGCGKSTLSDKLFLYAESVGIEKTICNADEWFYVNGEYRWDDRELSKAHAYSRGQFALAMLEKHEVIVVDNTNFKREHVMWYVDQAKSWRYHVVVVQWMPEYESDAHEMTRRSLHVPQSYDGWRIRFKIEKLNNEDLTCVQVVKMPFERHIPQQNRDEEYTRRGYYSGYSAYGERGETTVYHAHQIGRGYDRDVSFRPYRR